jgi:hypothetical protein
MEKCPFCGDVLELPHFCQKQQPAPEPPAAHEQKNPTATERSQSVTRAIRKSFNDGLTQREEIGIRKYGQTLMSHNGRDCWLRRLRGVD